MSGHLNLVFRSEQKLPEYTIPYEQLNQLPIYKFLPKPYSAWLLDRGELRIRLLEEFRAIESDTRRDADEGQVSFRVSGSLFSDKPVSPVHKYVVDAASGIGLRPDSFGDFELKTRALLEAPKALTLCFTSVPTIDLAKKFGDYPVGKQGCKEHWAQLVRIVKFGDFVQALDEYLGKQFGCDPAVVQPVQYADRVGDDNQDRYTLNSAFIKDMQFSEEHEWRCVWKLNDDAVAPVDVCLPYLAKFLKRVSRKELKSSHLPVAIMNFAHKQVVGCLAHEVNEVVDHVVEVKKQSLRKT